MYSRETVITINVLAGIATFGALVFCTLSSGEKQPWNEFNGDKNGYTGDNIFKETHSKKTALVIKKAVGEWERNKGREKDREWYEK